MSLPLVSVVVPMHNSAETILRALDSVALQDYPAIETIAVDDASTDATCAIVVAYRRLSLRLIRLTRHSGVAEARNAGVAASSGRYVAFLDSDDEWRAGKISRQVAFLECDPRLGIVGCDATFINALGEPAWVLYEKDPPVTGRDAWRTLLTYSFLHTSCVLTRRTALEQAGAFDPALIVGQDQDMWIRLALVADVGVVKENLVVPDSSSWRPHA